MPGFGLCSRVVDLGFHFPQLGRRMSVPGKLEHGIPGSDQDQEGLLAGTCLEKC